MCAAVAVALGLTALACDETVGTQPGSTTTTARLVFMGATARRTDLPAFAQACVNGVGVTHTHPSWRCDQASGQGEDQIEFVHELPGTRTVAAHRVAFHVCSGIRDRLHPAASEERRLIVVMG